MVTEEKKENLNVSSEVRPFFCDYDIEILLRKLKGKDYRDRIERNNLLLNLIRKRAPISKYELAKISGISYPTIKRLIKEFEFCDLVRTRISYSLNGIPVKLIEFSKLNESVKNDK